MALVAVIGIGTATPVVRRRAGSRRTNQLRTAEVFRLNRHLADQDVTRFGEELMDLHVETMTTDLDPAMRESYQRALDSYEDAKGALAATTTPEDVTGVVRTLADGRFHLASVLARRDRRRCRSGVSRASSTPTTARPRATSRGRRREGSSERSRSASATPSGSRPEMRPSRAWCAWVTDTWPGTPPGRRTGRGPRAGTTAS